MDTRHRRRGRPTEGPADLPATIPATDTDGAHTCTPSPWRLASWWRWDRPSPALAAAAEADELELGHRAAYALVDPYELANALAATATYREPSRTDRAAAVGDDHDDDGELAPLRLFELRVAS